MTISASRLDRRIDLQRAVKTQDEAGQEIETWENIATFLAASINPVKGNERFTADQFVADEQDEFWVRWSPRYADLNPMDRLVYPSGANPEPHEIYHIMAVHEVGRREGLKIMVARRPEQ